MKKNNATLVITAITLININMLTQGMLPKDNGLHDIVFVCDNDWGYIPNSKTEPNNSTIAATCRKDHIVTVLYAKYKDGKQFAGITNYSQPFFQSQCAALQQLALETQKPGIDNIRTIEFFCFEEPHQSNNGEAINFNGLGAVALTNTLHSHYLEQYKDFYHQQGTTIYANNLAREKLASILITNNYPLSFSKNTNTVKQCRVILDPENVTIKIIEQ